MYTTFHSFKTHWLKNHSDINRTETNAVPSTSHSTVPKSVVSLDATRPNSLTHDKKECGLLNASYSGECVPIFKLKPDIIQTVKVRKELQKTLLDECSKINSTLCPQTQSQLFFESTQAIVNSGLNTIREELNDKYKSDPESSEVLKDVNAMFDTFKATLKKFNTSHKRSKILKKERDFLELIEFVVGERSRKIKRSCDGQVKMISNYATGILFPLREMLKKNFETPSVYDLVFRYKEKLENETNVISNFVQSKLWKRTVADLPNNSKQILPLFLFYDDFETGNALGSHAGTNKLGGVYISLPFLPPEYQSSLSSILHALLFWSKDREEFGNFAVFRTLLDELKFLESEGIELDLPQGKTTVYFKLGLVIGDNLGLHSLLGFIESFNANYSCRFCKMNKIQRSFATMEDKAFCRTVESYLIDLQLQDPSRTGIKADCIFHYLPNFHVTRNRSVDIMHDMLEGVCLFDIVLILKYYIYEAKLFTLEQLNSYMESHNYGTSSNIPPPIMANHLKNDTLRMSAAEMSNFFLHLGTLVGHLIPRNDPVWQVYLILRQIFALVTSISIQEGCSELLSSLVKEHHRLAQTVLHRKLKPKDHLLLHYGSVMADCGPLIHLWGMRFESKHKESKDVLASSNCKTNICKSIAVKVQWKLSHGLHTEKIFTLGEKCGPLQPYILKDLPISFANNLLNDMKLFSSVVQTTMWIERNGSLYKPGMVLCVGENDNHLQFGVIKYIFIDNNVLYFVTQGLSTLFNDHIYAYEVFSASSTCNIQAYENLFYSRPLTLTRSCAKKFIILKSEL